MKIKLKPFLVIAGIIALIVAMKYLGVQDYLRQALDWIESLGPWGPGVFIATYILACVFVIFYLLILALNAITSASKRMKLSD